jgi:hypothetical protein
MWANHPEIAKRWADESGVPEGLPGKIAKTKKKKRRIKRRQKAKKMTRKRRKHLPKSPKQKLIA